MAISVDYTGARFCINVPQSDLTLISGTLYEHDTDAFWDEVKAWEASHIGIVFEDMQSYNAPYTVFGTTYAPKVEILNETNSSNTDLYQVCYVPDTAYSVRLVGSNNNIADVQNLILKNTTTQVIPGNAAGLIYGQLTAADVAQLFNYVVEGTETFAEQMRLIRADAAGKIVQAGDGSYNIRDAADSKNRITGDDAANGGRDISATDGT